MSQTLKSSTAESAIHTTWEKLQFLEMFDGEELDDTLRKHSDGLTVFSKQIFKAARRAFYVVREALELQAGGGKNGYGNKASHGRELPQSLPRLRPRMWQRIAPRLRDELPSNERLEHWESRLFWIGFSAVSSAPGHLSFALNAEWGLAEALLHQLRTLADLSRNTEMQRARTDPLEDLPPNTRFVFRRLPDMVAVRAFDEEYHYRFRREPVGFRYIERLLRTPDRALDLADLDLRGFRELVGLFLTVAGFPIDGDLH